MFPDLTLLWTPFPTEIDGIGHPPFVLDKGVWKGVLHLAVFGSVSEDRAYGVSISCEAYAGFDERIYSAARESDNGSRYDGTTYIKEARDSALIRTYTKADYLQKVPRHFLFVGNDYCYECLSFEPPKILSFVTQEQAYSWQPTNAE